MLSLLVVAACCTVMTEGGQKSLQAFLERAEVEGIISPEQAEQLGELAKRVGGVEAEGQSEREEEEEPRGESVFKKMYNHLTLLNVLYFSGALLIMGAYTLFMTLAFEKCDANGLSFIMLLQTVLLGAVGVTLWIVSEDFQFVGGL